MRSEQEVYGKFQSLCSERLKRRKDEFLSQCPRNCKHNCRLRVRGEKGRIGFCQSAVVLGIRDAKVFVCNDDETAQRCKVYECKNTCESVEKDFQKILRSPAQCGNDYPKLAILIWFLQRFEPQSRGRRFAAEFVGVFHSLVRIISLKWW